MVGGAAETVAPGPGEPPATEAAGDPSAGHPIAPTELPMRRSARRCVGFATRNAGPPCDVRPSAGGYQPPVTPAGGYGLRLTPECLSDSDSHRPTIHRLRRIPRGKPHGSSDHPRPAAVLHRGKPHWRAHATVGWGDLPPGRSQRRPRKADAVVENSARGWRSCGCGTGRRPSPRVGI